MSHAVAVRAAERRETVRVALEHVAAERARAPRPLPRGPVRGVVRRGAVHGVVRERALDAVAARGVPGGGGGARAEGVGVGLRGEVERPAPVPSAANEIALVPHAVAQAEAPPAVSPPGRVRLALVGGGGRARGGALAGGHEDAGGPPRARGARRARGDRLRAPEQRPETRVGGRRRCNHDDRGAPARARISSINADAGGKPRPSRSSTVDFRSVRSRGSPRGSSFARAQAGARRPLGTAKGGSRRASARARRSTRAQAAGAPRRSTARRFPRRRRAVRDFLGALEQRVSFCDWRRAVREDRMARGGGARRVRPEGQPMRCVVQLLTADSKSASTPRDSRRRGSGTPRDAPGAPRVSPHPFFYFVFSLAFLLVGEPRAEKPPPLPVPPIAPLLPGRSPLTFTLPSHPDSAQARAAT